MSSVEKISIALTPEMAAIVRQAVEDGDYATTSEVMREALRDWKLKRSLQRSNIADLRQLWDEGLESGRGTLGSMENIRRAARNRQSKE